MLPLQPSLADDKEQDFLDFLAAHDLPDHCSPDPEDLGPWWLID
jgi:hypothetical protein